MPEMPAMPTMVEPVSSHRRKRSRCNAFSTASEEYEPSRKRKKQCNQSIESNPSATSVYVTVRNGEAVNEYKINRKSLCNASDAFRIQMASNPNQSIHIKHVKPSTFELIRAVIESKEESQESKYQEILTHSNVTDILYFAHRYQMPSLLHRCKRTMCQINRDIDLWYQTMLSLDNDRNSNSNNELSQDDLSFYTRYFLTNCHLNYANVKTLIADSRFCTLSLPSMFEFIEHTEWRNEKDKCYAIWKWCSDSNCTSMKTMKYKASKCTDSESNLSRKSTESIHSESTQLQNQCSDDCYGIESESKVLSTMKLIMTHFMRYIDFEKVAKFSLIRGESGDIISEIESVDPISSEQRRQTKDTTSGRSDLIQRGRRSTVTDCTVTKPELIRRMIEQFTTITLQIKNHHNDIPEKGTQAHSRNKQEIVVEQKKSINIQDEDELNDTDCDIDMEEEDGTTCDVTDAQMNQMEVEEESPESRLSTISAVSAVSTISNWSDTQQIANDKTLLLDRDRVISALLVKHGFRKCIKVESTGQGSVWRACRLDQKVVIKIALQLYCKNEYENILNEVKILRDLKKHNKIQSVIKLIEVIEEEEYFMMILEDGGSDLFNFTTECHRKIASGTMRISDWITTTRQIAQKLAEIICNLHAIGLCHLDLSLENVLIQKVKWIRYNGDSTRNKHEYIHNGFELRLIDFGAARYVEDGHSLRANQLIGKLSYCAPQIFERKSFDGMKADCWSFGVSLFTLIVGANPWERPDVEQNKLYQKIVVEGNMEEILKIWRRTKYVEDGMRILLKQIFVLNEGERSGIREILKGLGC